MSWEDPLEKELAIHSSILAWKSHGQRSWWVTVHGFTKDPHNLATEQHHHIHIFILVKYPSIRIFLRVFFLKIRMHLNIFRGLFSTFGNVTLFLLAVLQWQIVLMNFQILNQTICLENVPFSYLFIFFFFDCSVF